MHSRPDLIGLLESCQEFADPANGWLPDFATLSNENKHEQLSVTRYNEEPVAVREESGVRICRVGSGTPTSLVAFRGFAHEGSGGVTALYISFAAIGQEVKWFLQTAARGPATIVDRVRKVV